MIRALLRLVHETSYAFWAGCMIYAVLLVYIEGDRDSAAIAVLLGIFGLGWGQWANVLMPPKLKRTEMEGNE